MEFSLGNIQVSIEGYEITPTELKNDDFGHRLVLSSSRQLTLDIIHPHNSPNTQMTIIDPEGQVEYLSGGVVGAKNEGEDFIIINHLQPGDAFQIHLRHQKDPAIVLLTSL